MMDDKEFLHEVSDRLVSVHGEDPHSDFINRLREIADAQPSPDGPFEYAAFCNGDMLTSNRDRDKVTEVLEAHRAHRGATKEHHQMTLMRRPLAWTEVP